MKNEKQLLTVGTAMIPCTVESMNLSQYVETSRVVSTQKATPEDWEALFIFLGAKEEELAEMEVEEFGQKVLEFVQTMSTAKPKDLDIKDIETEKTTFTVELNEEKKIKVSNILRKKAKEFIQGKEGSIYACAIFYQDVKKNSLVNNSNEEIERRKKLFAKMNCQQFIPFMGTIMNRFVELASVRMEEAEKLNEIEQENVEEDVTK